MRNLFEHPLFIVVLLALVAVLFGGKRLPDAARGLGRSMRIFKSEIKQMHDEDDERAQSKQPVEGRVVEGPTATTHQDAPDAAEQRDQRA
ncbi:Sec-independent protein translocase subunit TatA [Angustibacter sp. McL0619]|uniref:Sec-independent protein translocase subunit TatA n=1 Tax=Angustibacter sp. McL0619 TaxID=3415676 RepID=UPI003CE9A6C0